LHIFDKAALDVASPIEIELEVGHGGLEIVMAQAVFNVRDGLTPMEKIHGPRVSKGVNRVDVLKALWRQRLGEMLLADTINAVAGEFLSTLTDKEPVLIKGLWGHSILLDVETEKLRGPLLEVYEPKPISLSQDGEGILLRVEVVEIEGGDLGGPGARVEKEMKQGVIPEPLFSSEVDRLKDLQDLVMVEEPDQGPLITLLGDVQDGIRHLSLIRMHEADHFGKGFQGRKSMVPGPWEIFPLTLQVIEEREDELGGDMIESERPDLDTMILCGEGQKKFEGIPVGLDGIGAHPFNVREIVVEVLVDEGVELHSFLFCQREKSTRSLRLLASVTLRYTEVCLYSL